MINTSLYFLYHFELSQIVIMSNHMFSFVCMYLRFPNSLALQKKRLSLIENAFSINSSNSHMLTLCYRPQLSAKALLTSFATVVSKLLIRHYTQM